MEGVGCQRRKQEKQRKRDSMEQHRVAHRGPEDCSGQEFACRQIEVGLSLLLDMPQFCPQAVVLFVG